MNRKTIKIYLYPLVAITISLIPWWAFSKYVLKFDYISFLSSSTNTSYRSALVFFIFVITSIYIGWVLLNMWIENSKSIEERDNKVEKFFLNYGKVFAGLVAGQFFFILLAFIIF